MAWIGEISLAHRPCCPDIYERNKLLKRSLYKPLGFTFLLLGAAGILLPVLPSTPFVLLAAWFFARSSEKWHRRLLHSELFGNLIRNWESRRCIPGRAKAMAVISMLAAGTASITFAMQDTTLRLVTAGLMAIGFAVVLSIKTCPDCENDSPTQRPERAP